MDEVARRLCQFVLLLGTVGLFGASPPPPDSQTSEYQVKAAFLLNFTKFAEWPSSEANDSRAPFAICIWGDDPFGRLLDQMVEGESVNGRKLVVERIRREPSHDCQVVFINKAERDTERVLASFEKGILTIGEGDRFLSEGGMISFVLENRRVRFDINSAAAAKAGIRLSSKLLNVARAVER